MSDYYFSMQGLTVGYSGKPVIRDINIDINKGDIVTLIGPNGAGKSTILKSITRQLALIEGKVIFDTDDIHKMSYKSLSSKMAVVLTERLHLELMTCHDIVATGRYPYTGRLGILSREDEQKVDDAIHAVHAEEIGGKDFNAISDGQRQRILLARAICQEPDIIILDEPTSFLDVKYKLELLSILRGMAKKNGITVITSLHEIDLAEKFADKVICVKGDHIFRYGRPEDIFKEDLIRELYDIDNGYFDTLFGSIELPKPEGEPKTMVISSGGSGMPVFRKLQRENRPFIAAVLYENDMDYELARLLADHVVTAEPFEEVSEEAYQKALKDMEACDTVIDAGVKIGTMNRRVADLLEAAREAGKLQSLQEFEGDFESRAEALRAEAMARAEAKAEAERAAGRGSDDAGSDGGGIFGGGEPGSVAAGE